MAIMADTVPGVEQRILVGAVKSSPRACSSIVLPAVQFMGCISTLLMSLTLPRNFWKLEGGGGGKVLIK